MTEERRLRHFRKEIVDFVDKEDPGANGRFVFLYSTGQKPIPEEDNILRKQLGLDLSDCRILDPKLKRSIATVLWERGSITYQEIKSLGGKIVRRKNRAYIDNFNEKRKNY